MPLYILTTSPMEVLKMAQNTNWEDEKPTSFRARLNITAPTSETPGMVLAHSIMKTFK